MIKYLALILFAGLLMLAACDETPTGTNTAGEVTVRGQIFNRVTNQPLDSVVVQIKRITPELAAVTDGQGRYEFTFQVEETQEVLIVAFKETYIGDSTEVIALGDRIIDVPPMQMTPTLSTVSPSGNAASLYLFNLGNSNISIRSSGDIEFTNLVFEAVDSVGNPVDIDHSVDVTFRLGGSPGGGEFLHPLTVTTGIGGKAETFLFSGTTAGPVQVYAEASVDGETITSEPITVNIYGGLPDADHFNVGPDRVNIPGWHISGIADLITAFVGDRFSNPVRPGTPVYFSSTGGIIEGGGTTNAIGQVTVNLFSTDPRPAGGFAIITASTVDENEITISKQTQVLFSGPPRLTISPQIFAIPNGGQQTFSVGLEDLNGNPMSQGQSMNVSFVGPVTANGDLSVNIPDTQSSFWTNFSFTLADATDSARVAPVLITVRTNGPNGSTSVQIAGTSE